MKNRKNDKRVSEVKIQLPERDAGILLHITSLPSPFGIGDVGPEARKFADFLSRSHQKYWQLLPLNPCGKDQGYSPYSSISSMAGNTLLISPELLAADGLLDKKMLRDYYLPVGSKVMYEKAEKVRNVLFEKAYSNFTEKRPSALVEEFDQFMQQEQEWLHDYALFLNIRSVHDDKPWYQWPDKFKFRDQETLKTFAQAHTAEIEKVTWLQFIFSRQWNELKKYCNHKGIQLFGDMPFYVSYDSADVWANPQLFSLDDKGNIAGVAGVPPDYFNSNGQLWGMPVFRWEELQKQGYAWWVKRMKRNVRLFDLIRLDHFRAFAEYWEVPAGNKTARNGTWKPGPGVALFNVLRSALGHLPFIAEDLGDIDQAVRDLRTRLKLPGMKVLQFAFADNMPESEYIPHNYGYDFIAYTGTHDNNTTRGWFRKDLMTKDRQRLQQYAGVPVNERNVHLIMSRMAYASVAKTAILPMQDILGLNEIARMNTPASMKNNWLWRMRQSKFATEEKMLREWTSVYRRRPEVGRPKSEV